jgi:predicted Holliday junction resolvase-like endonuclease
MKFFKLLLILVILMFVVVACDKVSDMTQKAKKIAVAAKQQATEIAVKASDVAEHQISNATQQASQIATKTKDAAEHQVDYINQRITVAVNNAVMKIVNEIKAWIYEELVPFFPWMFIISFLLLYVALKSVIPFANFSIVQLSLSIIAYSICFYLFAKVGLMSFAIKGSLWFIAPIAIICAVLYLFKNSIFPKIASLNNSFISKISEQAKALKA